MIAPEWDAPRNVRVLVTTRDFGDVSREEIRRKLRALLPSDPAWLKQVHGKRVIHLDEEGERQGDAALTRTKSRVCVVQMADCMPVLFADEAGTTVAAAHAGWRGLAAGVLEATIDAMNIPSARLLAWLGPAIGPKVYEVGDEVRAAFRRYEQAFTPTRPGHWLLDLYAVASAKLRAIGVTRLSGSSFCTYSDRERFFSYRRDRTSERMAALIWLA